MDLESREEDISILTFRFRRQLHVSIFMLDSFFIIITTVRACRNVLVEHTEFLCKSVLTSRAL